MLEGRSDVLVVGAGPAGCAAGITLARAGVNVSVVDRASFPRDKTCGDALSNRAVALLGELGAKPRLDRDPHALVRRAAAVFPGDLRVVRDYAEPGWIVPRLSLDDAMRESLEAAGAKLLQGVQVRRIDCGASLVERIVGDGFDWRAPIVIAADGPNSVAWTALGRSKPRGRALAVATTAYYEGIAYPNGAEVADHYFEHQLPHGYAWVFPAVAGRSNVGVYQRDDARHAGRRLSQLLDEFIALHPERFANARQVGARRSWPLPLGIAGPVAARGIMLVGDAGGFVDPLSGEGIFQALFSGRQAGRAAIEMFASADLERMSAVRARAYVRSCEAEFGRHNRVRARVQDAMTLFMQRELYRSSMLRKLLQHAYAHGISERAKHA